LSVIGTDGRSAKAAFRVFVVEKSADSFVRRRDILLPGRTASGAGADGCEPPGGQDALEEECRLTLVIAVAVVGLTLIVPRAHGEADCAFADRPACTADLENMLFMLR